jgi:SET domain-containing protein
MKRVFVAPTGRTGRGLFAAISFATGQTILVIKGRRRTATYDGRYRIGPRWIGIGDGLWIEPTPGSHAWFINHSCNANAVITAERALVAVAPIAKGQEIWIDYSTTEADPHWKMTCKCGVAACRGVIQAVHSLPPDMYERYRPFLASFVLRARATSRAQ